MKSSTLRLVTTAMLIALATVITQTIRLLSLGTLSSILSPMHLPVMIIGLLCGWQLGLIGGILTPLISFAISGGTMPYFPTTLVPMLMELSLYGVIMGLSRRYTIGNNSVNIVPTLATITVSVIIGRLGGAVIKSLILVVLGTDSFWASLIPNLVSSAVSSWVSIVIIFVLLPTIVLALKHSGILLKYTDEPTATAQEQQEPVPQ